MIGQSIVALLDLCMPTCMNARVASVTKEETQCLKNCVRGLHASHVRTFQYMMDFEAKVQDDNEQMLA